MNKINKITKITKYNTYSDAIQDNNLEWLQENSLPQDKLNYDHYLMAAENKNLEILNWLLANGCPKFTDDLAPENMAAYGNTLALKWFVENDFPVSSLMASLAAQFCHLECLKWLFDTKLVSWLDKKYYVNPNFKSDIGQEMFYAMYSGNGNEYKEYYCGCRIRAINEYDEEFGITRENRLEVMNWLLENGCPKNPGVMKLAIELKDEVNIEWLIKNGWKIEN